MQYLLMAPVQPLLIPDSDKFRKKRVKAARRKRYRRAHPDKVLAGFDRKRGFGSILLNDLFRGGSRHHVDKIHIICIPMNLHKAFFHNQKKPETMVEINRAAFQYLTNSIRQL